MRSFDLDPRLLALMAAQRGVATTAQALALGYSEGELQRLRRGPRRVLTSLRRGVYALHAQAAAASVEDLHRLRIAGLYIRLGDTAVLSHESAAIEHGMLMLDADLALLHVTRETHGARHEADVAHHVAELPEDHVVRRDGVFDLTSPARTAVDIARACVRLECAVAVLDSALRLGVSRDELDAVWLKCRSWPGARSVARALAMADGRAANPGESWSRAVLVEEGVPPLDLQVAVFDDEGLIGYSDFGWEGVLGEFDGRAKYGIGADVDPQEAARIVWREKRREDRLRVRHEVVRWGYADLARPALLAGRVRAAMARAAERRDRSG